MNPSIDCVFRVRAGARAGAALLVAVTAAIGAGACAQDDVVPVGTAAPRVKLGYTVASSNAQQQLETRFRDLVTAGSMSALHAPLTRRPHPAGSAGTRAVVKYLQDTLGGFGLEVTTHEYQVLLAQPRSIAITMTAPERRRLSTDEPALAQDATSSHPELTGGYVAYSASGTAAGQVVYVNYGLPADYEELAALGVSLRGKIALARYGRSHRAVKTHTAEQAGARALILYSDPGDDGAAKGPAWPDGYWRGEQMLQRGNAKYSWFWHGDALTPGVGATNDAVRIDEKTAPTLPKIPVVVLSWGEAQHLMAALGGPDAPERFRGGLKTPYRVGPGPAAVSLAVDMDQKLAPIYDVVASIRGTTSPERAVLFGTHHDAWTFGGVDPGTGTTALLEVAKGLGQLAKSGWKPARTISLAFWDAEEFGLVGSTEYAEDQRARLQEQLIMYVNIDMYMRGRFDPGGVPSLAAFVADVARDVPEGASTVYERWQASELARLPAARRPADASAFVPDLKPLGSGADFVPFQDHLGVPTMAIEFIGDNGYGYGTYHTNYDSRAYVEQVADPGFTQGVLMAQVLGTMALRMSQADVVPFRFAHYGEKLIEAVDAATAWAKAAAMAMDVTALRTGAEAVRVSAAALEGDIDGALATGRLDRPRLAQLNDILARMEQRLADDDGAADTKWYRHVFYGWNIYSLYDGQPFPGLAEALRVKDAARVTQELGRIERALGRMDGELTAARALAPLSRTRDAMDEQQQLLLWKWSTTVQMTSLAMIATFFVLLARFGRRTELRWWAVAWSANLLALAVTLIFWNLQPSGLLPLASALYVTAKTAFVLLFVQGVWAVARPGPRLLSVKSLAAILAAYGVVAALFLDSIPAIGVAQHLTMVVVFLPLAVVTARTPGLVWLSAGVAVRGLLSLVEAGAYALQIAPSWGAEWRAAGGAFMSASSAFDMSAEWLLVLGSVLAVSARTQRDLETTNRELLAAHEHLRAIADRDPLTTLANRRALSEVFRAVQPVGAMLLFFDLDGFKALNDRYGHLAGDRCLREFAGALRDSFRPDDYVIRYGGDEFLVVAQGLDRVSAVARIDDLAARVRRQRQQAPSCEFSVGMSELVANGQPEAALLVADAEMYRAKSVK